MSRFAWRPPTENQISGVRFGCMVTTTQVTDRLDIHVVPPPKPFSPPGGPSVTAEEAVVRPQPRDSTAELLDALANPAAVKGDLQWNSVTSFTLNSIATFASKKNHI